MPIYEYKCEKCGNVFEKRQPFSDQPLTTHDECGGHVRRLISPAALQFKGSGWYVTDYARGNGNSPAGSGTSPKTGTSSESSTAETSSKSGAATPASGTTATETKSS